MDESAPAPRPTDQQQEQAMQRAHFQFAPDRHPDHRYSSQPKAFLPEENVETGPLSHVVAGLLSCLLLVTIGHLRDFFRQYLCRGDHHLKMQNGYAPIISVSESFYMRRLNMRGVDCAMRPTTGVPGRKIVLLDRGSHDRNRSFFLTGTRTEALNLSSYNYLGFAQSDGPCADAVGDSIHRLGTSAASSSPAVTCALQLEVEQVLARFVGKEASIIFSMGFSTNTSVLPSLVGPRSLILSDELNHASIRMGARLSGAPTAIFKHNDMHALENQLRTAIAEGQPSTRHPWEKILVVVEGLYSMEGTVCNLPAILALKRRYRFYLFIDEAHSIGALGGRGRGVCDYFGVDPAEVDVLMGTLTKSFGATGGYVAATHELIHQLRATNPVLTYGEPPSPAVLAQIATALRMISGEGLVPGHGAERLQQLAFNSRYLRLGLRRLGFIIYGHDESPIVPLLVINPAKLAVLSRLMLERKIAVVVIAVPAVPLALCRARLCVSAAHSLADLNQTLAALDEIGDVLKIKMSSTPATGALIPPQTRGRSWRESRSPPRWPLSEVIEYGVQDAKRPF
ncbi:serine palmitoyltransferase [Aspergillus brunneoviolaceus CBS 621.78]|uniref:Serine palmitoyltransferase n=1 Tax=Aspergillus brunneoviolaceus CBS 621.78 TaxID=1450534 RepID=A0ACD1GMN8_9EURO|nr:serine palmitoyltransferase [Aspergillus brunneoviolaceus CBS 621.78]RAH50531.1 serine palmitoyltransferase [Aspergillus brunneoviolaceus CBS 621.78]